VIDKLPFASPGDPITAARIEAIADRGGQPFGEYQVPLAILALPFLDLSLAFVRRTYAGKWWFLPDKQHLHHRLLERGHSQRRAVLLMYVWSALVSFGVIILGLVQTERQWTVVAVVAAFALILLVVTLGRPLRARNQVRRGESLR